MPGIRSPTALSRTGSSLNRARAAFSRKVGPGDRVGAAFSGSFPGLNLAVLSACQVMEVELVYICSAGASTYAPAQCQGYRAVW